MEWRRPPGRVRWPWRARGAIPLVLGLLLGATGIRAAIDIGAVLFVGGFLVLIIDALTQP